MRVFLLRFLGAIAYPLALTVLGAVGYAIIEGWSWQEALYMTMITRTALGFQEVQPLSELGRDFTMVLLALGITGVGIWFALITSFIVETWATKEENAGGHVCLKSWAATSSCVGVGERVGR